MIERSGLAFFPAWSCWLLTCGGLCWTEATAGAADPSIEARSAAPMPNSDSLTARGDELVEAIQQQVESVFQRCRPAVARIEASDAHGRLSGTGFFIDPNGTLYTSYTVGGESQEISVTFAGRTCPATRLVSDLRSGVALLKIDAQTPFLTPGKSRALHVTAPVITIGYPMDLPLTPAFGTIGGFDLKFLGYSFATTHIRANIPVQRGEGGAPLLNTKGEVIGILISRLDGGTASFALPIEAAEKVRHDFLRFREVRPGWIGVHVKQSENPVHGSTAVVDEVFSETPAEKAGLRAGDVLLSIGEAKITCPDDIVDASYFMTADDLISVHVSRGTEDLQLVLQPADHPMLGRLRSSTYSSSGQSENKPHEPVGLQLGP